MRTGMAFTTPQLDSCKPGVDTFAVANTKEAADIREMGSGWPILVLGPLLPEEDQALLDYDLIAALSSPEELARFQALAQKKQSPNPGSSQNRHGNGKTWSLVGERAVLDQGDQTGARNQALRSAHAFCATFGLVFTKEQRKRFLGVIEQAKLGRDPSFLVHADNSSSLRSLEDGTVFNAVRIGLLQFGIASPRGSLLEDLQVEPVLSFHSKLAMIKELPKGTSLSYDRQYTLKRNSKIGIISRLRRCHPPLREIGPAD